MAIYQLRTAYLSNIHDGVGERLININSAFLNDPAFRAAGWVPSAIEIKRTYSPPIPTAVTSEYFQAPPQSAGIAAGDDEEEGGMITGVGSNGNDTLGPALVARRRRRKEQLEEDDSSDLSDESDEELEATQRPANQIKFARMPNRTRSGSSPAASGRYPEGANLLVISPSRPPDSHKFRAGSLTSAEGPKPRSRRGTGTSSDISSEPDLDPSVFRRQEIHRNRAGLNSRTLAERIQELDENQAEEESRPSTEVVEAVLDDSSLSSGFSEAADANSLLEGVGGPLATESLPSLTISRPPMPRSISSRKTLEPFGALQALPPSRPISTVIPVSALAQAIKAKNMKPANPFDRFATLSGAGSPDPLYIKIYVPNSNAADTPLEVVLSKNTNEGSPVTVAEATGFTLWKYGESGIKPAIAGSKMNVNWWTFRMVEDGEVEYDFPPLTRTRPISDFTSNNNRGARGRSREKPWDEFALVEANAAQFQEHEGQTPIFSQEAAAAQERAEEDAVTGHQPQPDPKHRPLVVAVKQHPITGSRFAPQRQDSMAALDVPSAPISHATERTGAEKDLNVHYTDKDFRPGAIVIEATTDTYLAEVFDQVCKKLNVDKALYVLKVTNTTTVAPTDRTVEALGPDRSSLDLVRRRFIGDGAVGFFGSPGSSSPNAPLLLTTAGTPRKPKRGAGNGGSLHPLAQTSDVVASGSGSRLHTSFRRYAVIRKQPMSFAPSHPRVIALDDEYLHIMPGDSIAGREKLFDTTQGKISTVHYSSVVGCKVNRKHPKTFRLIVFKERETKRYDFEAANVKEADEIVHEIKRGMEPFKDSLPM